MTSTILFSTALYLKRANQALLPDISLPDPSSLTIWPVYSLTAISCPLSGPGTALREDSHCPQGTQNLQRQTCYVPRHGMGKAGQAALGTQAKEVLIQEGFLEKVPLITV